MWTASPIIHSQNSLMRDPEGCGILQSNPMEIYKPTIQLHVLLTQKKVHQNNGVNSSYQIDEELVDKIVWEFCLVHVCFHGLLTTVAHEVEPNSSL